MFRIGLVGYGFMGKMHSQCYRATGMAEMVAIADIDPTKREEARVKFGCAVYDSIEAMLAEADVDVVDICTPTYQHEHHVVAAAKAGKQIMCEKPMSIDTAGCERMIEAVKSAGVTLMIGQAVRFEPMYEAVKRIAESGQYGRIQWVSATRVSAPADWTWDDWLFDPARSGGGILDLHIHDIDFFNYLLGLPTAVTARGSRGKGGGIDSAQTLMEHAGGVSSYALATIDAAATTPFHVGLLVNLERATIKIDLAQDPMLMVYPSEGEPYTPELPKEEIGESTEALGNVKSLGAYLIEIRYFLNCLKDGRRPEVVTPEAARDAVRVCLAATESVETGRTIHL